VALTHLADTSVLTRLSSAPVRDALEPLVESGSVARAGITDLEVGFSARNAAEWVDLTTALSIFELIESTAVHVARARQVQRLLAERRLRGRTVPDLLIASAAEERGLIVLHYDADFDVISSVTGQHVEWVVARGSID
jgi:predicted nucleic acid-binding protein